MRRNLFSVLAVLALALGPLGTLAEAGHGSDLDTTLGRIMAEQGAAERSDIDCGRVSDDDFAALGDAFMGVMHPDEQEHEFMDDMMGGEGSARLEAAHVLMGRRYLGCGSGGVASSGGTYGMMGGTMMGGMMGAGPWMMNGYDGTQGYGMMGYGAGADWSFGWLTSILIDILLVLGIVWVVRELFRPRKK